MKVKDHFSNFITTLRKDTKLEPSDELMIAAAFYAGAHSVVDLFDRSEWQDLNQFEDVLIDIKNDLNDDTDLLKTILNLLKDKTNEQEH